MKRPPEQPPTDGTESTVEDSDLVVPSVRVLDPVSLLFSAIADSARLQIIIALDRTSEMSVSAIADALGLKLATASFHLRRLREVRLVKFRHEGRLTYYSLRDREVIDAILNLRELITRRSPASLAPPPSTEEP